MVKNTQGGQHKNQARKHTIAHKGKIRLSTNENELYSKVVRMCGGKMCDIMAADGRELKCNIRGKFSGKNKRSHIIQAGSIVLVGLQDWQSEITRCDLLEVYDYNEVNILAAMPELASLFSESSYSNKVLDDLVSFEKDSGISYDTFIEPKVGKDEEEETVADEINFDDI